VVVFTMFVDKFSSYSSPSRLLMAGYIVPICKIGRAVARHGYTRKWMERFTDSEGEDCMDRYWETLTNLLNAANRLVNIDSKQVFTDYGAHLAKLLYAASVLEKVQNPQSQESITFFRSARMLALCLNSSLDFYSVIRVIRPRFIPAAAASTSPLGGMLSSLQLAILVKRRVRHLFLNEEHAMCAFPTVGCS
jgi:hypothetical protein